MYGNRGHFCCTIFIGGRFLFYDGIKKPKARWLGPDIVTHPERYHIVTIWYLRRDTSSAPTLELPSSIDPSSPMPEVDTQNASPDMETRSTAPEVVPFFHSKNSHHPVGISVSVVRQRGVIPKCKTCGVQIERGTSRLVLTEVTNEHK